jgi:hypothetical protein
MKEMVQSLFMSLSKSVYISICEFIFIKEVELKPQKKELLVQT